MKWQVILHDEVEKWFLAIAQDDPETADDIAAALDKLSEEGPGLGRPLADRIHSSRHHNMKELRPRTRGVTEIRILFAFDPERQALVLVAGDKRGSWNNWYDAYIPIADDRFDDHLAALRTERKRS